jgi:hypothetical protein
MSALGNATVCLSGSPETISAKNNNDVIYNLNVIAMSTFIEHKIFLIIQFS